EYLGSTPVDGAISHQSYKHTELGNGISPNGWRYTGRGSKGSKVVEKLQKWVGVGQDGVWYEGTTAALQRKLNEHGVGMCRLLVFDDATSFGAMATSCWPRPVWRSSPSPPCPIRMPRRGSLSPGRY